MNVLQKQSELCSFLRLQFLSRYHWSLLVQWQRSGSSTCPTNHGKRKKAILEKRACQCRTAIPANNKETYTVWPHIRYPNDNFQKPKPADQFQRVEESKVHFKGHSCLKKIQSHKANKIGIKLCYHTNMSGNTEDSPYSRICASQFFLFTETLLWQYLGITEYVPHAWVTLVQRHRVKPNSPHLTDCHGNYPDIVPHGVYFRCTFKNCEHWLLPSYFS